MRRYGAALFIAALLGGSGFAAAGIASKVARLGHKQQSTSTATGTVGTTGPRPGKVTICHRPPGNPDNAHTISVGEPAVPAHLGHGDTLGPCPDETTTSTVETDAGANKITICHRPPGNPDKSRTITVGEPAVPAHLGHGDTLGECETEESTTATAEGNGKGNGKGKGKGKGKPEKAAKANKKSKPAHAQGNGNGNGNGQGKSNGNGKKANGKQNAAAQKSKPPKGKPDKPGKPEGSGAPSQGPKPGNGKGPGGKPQFLSWIHAWVF